MGAKNKQTKKPPTPPPPHQKKTKQKKKKKNNFTKAIKELPDSLVGSFWSSYLRYLILWPASTGLLIGLFQSTKCPL